MIHGNKAQNARQRALNAFRNGQVRVLVATDIVARGIDVPGVTHIINYDLPDEPEAYVHRIGRTGRNGADGIAITLCAPDELKKLRAVEKIIRTTLLPGGHGRTPAAGGRRKPGRRRRSRPTPPAPSAPAAAARAAPSARPERLNSPARESYLVREHRETPMSLAGRIAWDDTVLPFQLDRADIRGRVGRLDSVLETILGQHDYPAPVAALVAEAALITALIGQTIKLRWKLSLQIRGEGPVRLIATDYFGPSEEGAPARMRAWAGYDPDAPRPRLRRGPSTSSARASSPS